MDPESVQIIILILCFIFSAFFSASETALLSVNKIHLRTLADEGNKKAQMVEKLLDDQDGMISTLLVGNNLVNILCSSITTSIAISMFGSVGVGYATGVVTLLILIFCEITPKTMAAKYADNLAMLISSTVNVFVKLLTPVVFILNCISHALVKLLGGNMEETPEITEEDLKTFVTVGHEAGVLESDEKDMIHNVFDFSDTEIREIMTPRINVVSIGDDVTYDELVSIYKEEQFSRLLVHSESYDEIVGVLYVKDLLFEEIDEKNFDVKKYMREPYYVYEFNHINDIFENMRKKRNAIAVVLDEYGVMSGLVTFEDIVEEIVGNIDDEYDDSTEISIKQLSNGSYLVDGAISFNELNDEIDTHFESDDFESIGGLVLNECKGKPKVHDQFIINDAMVEIEKIAKNRIALVKITKEEKADEEGEKDLQEQ